MEFTVQDAVAIATMDDGKANAVGHNFADNVNEALDKAAAQAKALVIAGRPRTRFRA